MIMMDHKRGTSTNLEKNRYIFHSRAIVLSLARKV